MDLRTAAVRFCTEQDLVDLTLVGASNPEQAELATAGRLDRRTRKGSNRPSVGPTMGGFFCDREY